MIIDSVKVKNFRCVKNECLCCEELTALIGKNGTGKSSFLRALDLFYTPNAEYDEEDFYNQDVDKDIIVEVIYRNLTEDEKEIFKPNIKDEKLRIKKVMKSPSHKRNQSYYGYILKNPEFRKFREASGYDLRKEYEILRKGNYSELPEYTNKDKGESNLRDWEIEHPNKCELGEDDGSYFGFEEIGNAHLERFTKFVLIPAIRDVKEDVEEGKNTPLTELMDLVVRKTFGKSKGIQELRDSVSSQYEEIIRPSKINELQDLEQDLRDILQTYAPESNLTLDWISQDYIEIPLPKAKINLIEDGYPSSVECCGHGLQRTFIITLLHQLAISQAKTPKKIEEEEQDQFVPNLIIGIEEPELFQHPNRQRHLSKILYKLANGNIEDPVNRTQVIYCTHSPLFIDLERFNQIRLFHKIETEMGKPKETKIIQTSANEVASRIWEISGKESPRFTGKTLIPRLRAIMTPWMNEGFFADICVLVEGEEDRAALLAIAKQLDKELVGKGISIIPCMGKNNLDRPTTIFKKLQIKTYTIWDSDKHKDSNSDPETNHRLLRLFNEPTEDWPEKIEGQFACFENDMTSKIKEEFGEDLYEELLNQACQKFCKKKKYAKKNPEVLKFVFQKAYEKGERCVYLEKVLNSILKLK